MDNGNRRVILAVDDDQELQGVLPLLLRDEGDVVAAPSTDRATDLLRTRKFDLAIVDLNFEGEENDGRFVLEELTKNHPKVPIIVLSGDTLTSRVVEATRYKLVDFVPKDQEFHRALVRAVKKGLSNREKAVRDSEVPFFETRSLAMQQVLDQVGQISRSDIQSPILITGESGTGKEVMAKHIAYLLKKPIVVANMAGIPHDLAEAELFGANEGAYTGASRDREGLIQKAQNGIFFLDEVGDCSLKVQATLLRTIQENEIKAVGSTNTRKIKVRFLAATNKDLNQMAAEKTFREDLLERLSTFPIRLLPLRERPEDILFYAEKFLKNYSSDKQFFISPSGESALLGYYWPRNVRELSNAIQRMIVLSPKSTIDSDAVMKAIEMGDGPTQFSALTKNRTPQREEIISALKRLEGNRTQTAIFFGVHKTTFLRWLKAWGIENTVPGRLGRPRELPERLVLN